IGAYGLLRIGFFPLSDAREEGALVLLVLGAAATIYGSILAVSRSDPARLAAYTTIVHAGHIVLAIGIGGEAGIAAALLIVLAGSVDKTILFLAFESRLGRHAAAFVAAASVAGLPPTMGFIAKVHLVLAALQGPVSSVIVVVIVSSAVLVLVAIYRFWRMLRAGEPDPRHVVGGAAILVLVAVSVLIGLYPEPATNFAWVVSSELLRGAG
ncbi:MAG: proton-conducting transporter membrane subunit, partial [Candidatus Hydrogenedentales bacterium]